jgi:cytoskeletal protein CcmA (bactofilin family)
MIRELINRKKGAAMRNRKEAVVTSSSSGRTTLISPGTTVRGDITFSGHLDIEGAVTGSIQAEPGQEAILRVVEGGTVAGEVKVPHAMINGSVEGDIHATERLELAESAVVDGDVYYNLIEMAVGAKVNGGLRHTSNVADDLAAKRVARAAETVPAGPTTSS